VLEKSMDNNSIVYRAVKYIRLSNADGNAGESDSVGNQRRLIDDFLKNHPEIEVVSEKVDDGWSGIIFDRPAFKEMMREIEEGRINCCITKDLSRLGREYIETGRYLRRIFPAYGVRFIAINDNIDTLNDRGDDLTVSLKSIINDAYCRDISVKTRSALKIKRSSGDYVGACPVYGYRRASDNRGKLEIDVYPAGIIKDIFRMKIDGMSAVRIAETLNERGVLSPNEYKKDRGLPRPKNGFADKDGAKWSATTIIRILKDETYTGTLIQGKRGTPNYKLKELVERPKDEWYRTENAHDAIIARHDFDLTQKIMRLDTRTSPNGDKVYLFSGVLICGCCGNRMTRKTVPGNGKNYYYYYCPTGKKNGCQSSDMIKETDLINCVLASVKSYIANIASLESIIDGLDAKRIGKELAERLSMQVSENEHRLEMIREYKTGLYENLINESLSKEEYKSLKEKYTEDIAILSEANERLRGEIEDALSCRHERIAWTEHFKQFANLDGIDRKTVVNLIHNIRIFSKTEIEVSFNFQAEYENVLSLLSKEAV